MLRRLYVHNFRTLVNFSLDFQEMNLLMGANGAGKSTIFDVLYKLRNLLSGGGQRVEDIFHLEDVTRWAASSDLYQQFELVVEDNAEIFEYSLKIEHKPGERRSRISAEKLLHEGRPLYEFEVAGDGSANARLYHDDYTHGGEFLADWSRSGVGALQERPYNTKLIRFCQHLRHLFIARLNVSAAPSDAPTEDAIPARDLRNFASWYRHLSQTQQSQTFRLTESLREIIPGFDAMSLQPAGESKLLNVEFRGEDGKAESYRFSQLSDGQRTLIILYTLLFCLPGKESVLCIDEPENFLALPEIQFWLDALEDRISNGNVQAILISHHPRLINLLAGNAGQWLYRDGAASPTRVKPVTIDDDGGLPASKLVEMGWLVDD